jgi:hypothetical protein
MALADESNRRNRTRTRKRADRGSPKGKIGINETETGPIFSYDELTSGSYLPQTQAYATDQLDNRGTVPFANPVDARQFPSGTGAGAGGQAQNFANEYYWNDRNLPFAVTKAMNGLGMSTDINSSFFNAMQDLAPGLKWMSLLGGSPSGGMPEWMNTLGGFLGNGQQGGMGAINPLIANLIGGGVGSPDLEGYIDSLDPQQLLGAIEAMMVTQGYGQVAPELIGGMSNQMGNLYNQWGAAAGDILGSLGEGQSDMDAFRQYLQQNGQNFLGYFGL